MPEICTTNAIYKEILETHFGVEIWKISNYYEIKYSTILSDLLTALSRIYSPTLAYLSNFFRANISDPIQLINYATKLAVSVDEGDFAIILSPLIAGFVNGSEASVGCRMRKTAKLILNGLELCLIDMEARFLEGSLPHPSEITSLIPVGDLHENGRCVRQVETTDGRCFFFKPRSAAAEQALELAFNLAFPTEDQAFSSVVCGSKDSHWVTRTNSSEKSISIKEISQLLRLAVICTTLGISDLHYENVIWSDLGPVPIDVEAIFSPFLPSDVFQDGMILTGLLPTPSFHAGGFIDDSPLVTKYLATARNQSLRPAHRAAEFDPTIPFAWIDTQKIHDLYKIWHDNGDNIRKQIIRDAESLTHIYGLVDEWRGVIARHVLRPTRSYYAALTAANVNDALGTDGFESALRKYLVPASQGNEFGEIVNAEHEKLRHGIIPTFHFSPDDTNLYHDGRIVACSFFKEKGAQQVLRRIKEASPSHHHDFIYMKVARSLEILASKQKNMVVTAGADQTLENFLSNYIAHIENTAIREFDGQVVWSDIAPSGYRNHIRVDNLGLGLYRGSAGIAVAIAAAAAIGIKSSIRWEDCFTRFISREAVKGGDGDFLSSALDSGTAGIIYAASLCLRVSGATSELKDVFAEASSRLFPEPSEPKLDLMQGTVGMLLCMRAAAGVFKGSYHSGNFDLGIARLEEDLISTMRHHRGGHSKGFKNIAFRPGVAHGLTGAALALARIQRIHFDDQSMFKIWCEDDLAAVYSQQNASWCGGTSGILRAMRRLGFSPDVTILQEHERKRQSSQICCGSLGILIAQHEFGFLNLAQLEQKLSNMLLNSGDLYSFDLGSTNAWSISLFQGMGGLAYYVAGILGKNGRIPAFEFFE